MVGAVEVHSARHAAEVGDFLLSGLSGEVEIAYTFQHIGSAAVLLDKVEIISCEDDDIIIVAI